MVYLFLADGFEETEALVTVDILRRAGIAVKTVGVGGRQVTGSHGIAVTADSIDSELRLADATAVVLPGGMPGTKHLEASPVVQEAVSFAEKNGLLLAAICAAPSILGKRGLLNGKRATCYPGFETALIGAAVTGAGVERDGRYITGKGAGAVMDFGFEIVTALLDAKTANSVKEAMQCK